MSKDKKIKPNGEKEKTVEEAVMSKVLSEEVKMKPRWYFVVGSLLTWVGLVGMSVGGVFMSNLTWFLLKSRGRMVQWRVMMMLDHFPWWIPLLAVIVMVVGVWFLKQYDFSYKKNFKLIVMVFLLSILISGWLISELGLNEIWSERMPIRRFYQQLEIDDKQWKGTMMNGEVRGERHFRMR